LKRDADPRRDKLTFRWSSALPVADDAFGDPLATDSRRVCIYDGTGLVLRAEVPPDQTCPGGPCWKRKRAGFVYRDTDGTPDGIYTMRLFPGSPGKIRTTGRGPNLQLGALPLVPPVRVRIEDGNVVGSMPCFGATFDAGIAVNTPTSFRGRSD